MRFSRGLCLNLERERERERGHVVHVHEVCWSDINKQHAGCVNQFVGDFFSVGIRSCGACGFEI